MQYTHLHPPPCADKYGTSTSNMTLFRSARYKKTCDGPDPRAASVGPLCCGDSHSNLYVRSAVQVLQSALCNYRVDFVVPTKALFMLTRTCVL